MYTFPYKKKYYFFLFLSFIVTLKIWFVWNINPIYFNLIIVLGLLFIYYQHKSSIQLELTKRNLIPFALYTTTLYIKGGLIWCVTTAPIAFFILTLRVEDKKDCLYYIIKWMSYLLVPSLILFLLSNFISLPSFGTVHFDRENLGYSSCENYLIFVKGDMYGIRFAGPFLEPGHLGMMISFLLFADGWNLQNRYSKILFVISFFTLSLAGYALNLIGYFLSLFNQEKLKLYYLLLVIIGIFGFYYSAISYNDGNNILNEKIVSRLEEDDEKGFVGNNRSFGLIPLYYANMLESGDVNLIMNGYPKKEVKWLLENGSRGTGFVIFFVINGLWGLLLASAFYISYLLLSRNKKMAIVSFVFVCIAFWQRSYPYWLSWILCYSFAISINGKNENNKGFVDNKI